MTNAINSATESAAWIRLWQLISPSLPIGAYAYSQGLETAVEKNWVTNEQEALNWIKGILNFSVGQLDAPVLARLYQGWDKDDAAALSEWNQFLLASRESSELTNEDRQMGQALWRLLQDIIPGSEMADVEKIRRCTAHMQVIDAPGYALVFALAAYTWKIPLQQALQGFLWAWCENQVAASIKLVPLGQTAGQRILGVLINDINRVTQQAVALEDEAIGSLAPGFGIVCAQHEVQYTRLFRS